MSPEPLYRLKVMAQEIPNKLLYYYYYYANLVQKLRDKTDASNFTQDPMVKSMFNENF